MTLVISYAICIFISVEKRDKINCMLVQARNLVAPLKNVTTPQFVFLACNIEARLVQTVKTDL